MSIPLTSNIRISESLLSTVSVSPLMHLSRSNAQKVLTYCIPTVEPKNVRIMIPLDEAYVRIPRSLSTIQASGVTVLVRYPFAFKLLTSISSSHPEYGPGFVTRATHRRHLVFDSIDGTSGYRRSCGEATYVYLLGCEGRSLLVQRSTFNVMCDYSPTRSPRVELHIPNVLYPDRDRTCTPMATPLGSIYGGRRRRGRCVEYDSNK